MKEKKREGTNNNKKKIYMYTLYEKRVIEFPRNREIEMGKSNFAS